jgi:hypothetical protein
MTALGKRVVVQARQDLGVSEEPPGSNTGRRVRQMQANTFLGGTGWPWCAAAVCTWYKEAGQPLGFRTAHAWSLAETGRRVSLAEAQPGDIVTFNIGSGHAAILETKTGHSVTTIGGNEGQKVRRTERPARQIRAIIRVADKKPPPPKKVPWAEMATSQSGRRVVLWRGPVWKAVKLLPIWVKRRGKIEVKRIKPR